MDWMDPIATDPAQESEDDISGLTTGLTARMRKRAGNSQGETNLSSEVLNGKRPKWSGPDEEGQNNPAVITMDSLKCASDALPVIRAIIGWAKINKIYIPNFLLLP